MNHLLILIFQLTLGLVLSPICDSADQPTPKSLTIEDLKKFGFNPKKVGGKTVDPHVNGVEKQFNHKDELIKFFEGIGIKYDEIKFDKSSDLLLTRMKYFERGGFWWHVREKPIGEYEKGVPEKIQYSVFALPIQ